MLYCTQIIANSLIKHTPWRAKSNNSIVTLSYVITKNLKFKFFGDYIRQI